VDDAGGAGPLRGGLGGGAQVHRRLLAMAAEPATFARLGCIALIVAGIVGLKLTA
jgi:multidrug transporter EmrE-like cation transporter